MKLGMVSGSGQQIPPKKYAAVEAIFWEIANRISGEIDVSIYSKTSSFFPKPSSSHIKYHYLNRASSMMDTIASSLSIYKNYVARHVAKDRCDLIQCNSPYFTELLSVPDARFIFSCHNAPGGGLDIDRFDEKTRSIVLETLDRSEKIHCVSGYVKRSLYPYVKDKNKLHVIFNGIDTKKFKPLRKENIVICVGRIIPTKGQLHLLKAFSEMDTDWKLLMVGTCLEGKENMRYYKECLKYGRDNIEFTGEIWGDRLVDLYGKARIAVIPSICQEALPMVTLEAMASGCAIVATAMGGIPEMISDGRNGFLVPPMDPGMIQDRLGTLMGNERLLNDMAVKAMDDAVNIFDWEKIAGQYLDFYRSLS